MKLQQAGEWPASVLEQLRDGAEALAPTLALRTPVPVPGPILPHARKRLPPMLLADPMLLSVVRAIESDRGAEVRIAELAAQAGLSEQHFQRRFSSQMGETIGDYGRRQRLEMAGILLKHGALSVLQIAVAAGYSSAEAFTRAFQRQLGCSPTEFRHAVRQAMQAPGPFEHELAARVSVEQREAGELLALRFYGAYAWVDVYWKLFAGQLARAGLDPEGRRLYVVPRDDPETTPAGLIRYDCAIEAPHPLPPALARAPFSRLPLPRTRVARLRHRGPFSSVSAAYRALMQIWLPANNRRPLGDGPALEVHRTLPWQAGMGEPESFEIELPIV